MFWFYAQHVDCDRFNWKWQSVYQFVILGFLFLQLLCCHGCNISKKEENSTESSILLFEFDCKNTNTQGYGKYDKEKAILTLHLNFTHDNSKDLTVELTLIIPEQYSDRSNTRMTLDFKLGQNRTLMVVFEHLFRGDYELEIQPIFGKTSYPRTDLQLPYLNTTSQYSNVSYWDLYLDAHQINNQSVKITLEDRNNTLRIFNFSRYVLTLENGGKFREINITLEEFQYQDQWTYRTVIEELDFGCYKIAVEALDIRWQLWCRPCKIKFKNELCVERLFITELPRQYPNSQKEYWMEIALGVATMVLILVALSVYCSRKNTLIHCIGLDIGNNNQENDIVYPKTVTLTQPLPVLLVYSSQNQLIAKQVTELRKYLEDTKLFQVHDIEDDREWQNRSEYGFDWWRLKLSNLNMRIIVIETPDMIQWQENHFHPVQSTVPIKNEVNYLLKQLHLLSFTDETNARIFVVNFESNEGNLTTAGVLPLQPFVRYQLPNHLKFLQNDLIQATSSQLVEKEPPTKEDCGPHLTQSWIIGTF